MTPTTAIASRMGLVVAAGAALLALTACQNAPHMPRLHIPMIQQPPACADFSISIYFEAASAEVTRDADALLRSAAGRARRCQVNGVDVVGLADASGASEANLKISKQRADAVTAALARHGFSTVNIAAGAAGETGAAAPAGAQRPLRRRADVTFHLEARK